LKIKYIQKYTYLTFDRSPRPSE